VNITDYQDFNLCAVSCHKGLICAVKLSRAKVTQFISFGVKKFCLDVSSKFDDS